MSDDLNPYDSGDVDTEAGDPTQDVAGGRRAAIGFILVSVFLDILGIGIIIPVLPPLVMELINGDESSASFYVGLIAASYSIMQFICAPIWGSLSDRFGRRPILLVSLFGWGIDFLFMGFANHIWLLFLGRLIAGVMGASITTANAYIADVSNDDNRARNFGFLGAMFGLGFIIGPSLGGLLGAYWIRLPFFVAAGLALINWMYGYFVLPESLPPEKRRRTPWKEVSPFHAIGRLGAYPIVAGLAVVVALKALAQRGLENSWVLYTSAKFDWSEITNGLMLGWVGVTAIIVQGGLVRPVVKRFGERSTLLVATIISGIAFASYAFAPMSWCLPLFLTFGALGGLAGPAIQSLITSTVDETEQGQIQGALSSLQSLTSVFAPILFTTGLFNYFSRKDAIVYFPGAPLLMGSVLIFVSFFVALSLFRRLPKVVQEQESVSTTDSSVGDAAAT